MRNGCVRGRIVSKVTVEQGSGVRRSVSRLMNMRGDPFVLGGHAVTWRSE